MSESYPPLMPPAILGAPSESRLTRALLRRLLLSCPDQALPVLPNGVADIRVEISVGKLQCISIMIPPKAPYSWLNSFEVKVNGRAQGLPASLSRKASLDLSEFKDLDERWYPHVARHFQRKMEGDLEANLVTPLADWIKTRVPS